MVIESGGVKKGTLKLTSSGWQVLPAMAPTQDKADAY